MLSKLAMLDVEIHYIDLEISNIGDTKIHGSMLKLAIIIPK